MQISEHLKYLQGLLWGGGKNPKQAQSPSMFHMYKLFLSYAALSSDWTGVTGLAAVSAVHLGFKIFSLCFQVMLILIPSIWFPVILLNKKLIKNNGNVIQLTWSDYLEVIIWSYICCTSNVLLWRTTLLYAVAAFNTNSIWKTLYILLCPFWLFPCQFMGDLLLLKTKK